MVEIEQVLGSTSNVPFVQCGDNFEQLDKLTKVPINCYKTVVEYPLLCKYVYQIKLMLEYSVKSMNRTIINDPKSDIKHFVLIHDMGFFKLDSLERKIETMEIVIDSTMIFWF